MLTIGEKSNEEIHFQSTGVNVGEEIMTCEPSTHVDHHKANCDIYKQLR